MTADFDALVEKAAHIIDPHAPAGHNMLRWWARDFARAALEAVGLPALLERVEAAEELAAEVNGLNRLLDAALAQRDALAAKVAERDERIGAVMRGYEIHDGIAYVNRDDLRAALTEAER